MEGWIKLHRKILKHWIFQDSEYLKYWIFLLMDVNHEDKKILWNKSLIEIKRGQKITSLQKLAEEFNCSREKIRRFLELLQNDKMIHIETNTKYTQITICNYDTYQLKEHTNNTPKKHVKNTKKTRTDTNKNVKNDNNEKKLNIPTYEDFKSYALEKNNQIDEIKLRLKYESWKENKWKDGNNKKITNWKSKLLNTIPYLINEKDKRNTNTPVKEPSKDIKTEW